MQRRNSARVSNNQTTRLWKPYQPMFIQNQVAAPETSPNELAALHREY